MRLVILSYSHHGCSIGGIARALGHEIVGAMDPEDAPRSALADEFDCPVFATAAECLDAVRIDAAVVAGKHVEMPGYVLACVERRIPYLLDKPFADGVKRLRPAAVASERSNVFNALTLPNRASDLMQLMARMTEEGTLGDPILYCSRLNNGPPTRYDGTPSAWHNDAAISGGGCWAVEGAHGIDAFLQFVGSVAVEAVDGFLSNVHHRRSVEDSAVGILRTEGGVTGIIETGYNYPSGTRSGDHFVRFVGSKATVMQGYGTDGEFQTEVHTSAGVRFYGDIGHRQRMRRIVEQALRALSSGLAFTPNISDAVRILEIQDAIYERARSRGDPPGSVPLVHPPKL